MIIIGLRIYQRIWVRKAKGTLLEEYSTIVQRSRRNENEDSALAETGLSRRASVATEHEENRGKQSAEISATG